MTMTDRIAFKSAGAEGPRSSRQRAAAERERLVAVRTSQRMTATELAPIAVTMATELDPITVTIQQACALSGLSHTTIYKLINAGKLRSVKIGRRTLVTYASLRGLLA
jgi:excisionase family DNA binding protein